MAARHPLSISPAHVLGCEISLLAEILSDSDHANPGRTAAARLLEKEARKVLEIFIPPAKPGHEFPLHSVSLHDGLFGFRLCHQNAKVSLLALGARLLEHSNRKLVRNEFID